MTIKKLLEMATYTEVINDTDEWLNRGSGKSPHNITRAIKENYDDESKYEGIDYEKCLRFIFSKRRSESSMWNIMNNIYLFRKKITDKKIYSIVLSNKFEAAKLLRIIVQNISYDRPNRNLKSTDLLTKIIKWFGIKETISLIYYKENEEYKERMTNRLGNIIEPIKYTEKQIKDVGEKSIKMPHKKLTLK